jgi:hypothetical protein
MLPTNRPPTHPGEMLLKEFLEPLGVSQVEAAKRMSIPFQRLNAMRGGPVLGHPLALAEQSTQVNTGHSNSPRRSRRRARSSPKHPGVALRRDDRARVLLQVAVPHCGHPGPSSPWWKSRRRTEGAEAPRWQGAMTENIGQYARKEQRS